MENIPNGMPKLIEDEAEDSMKYAHLAMEHKADHPDLADMFMQLSVEELKHMQMIAEKLAAMVEKAHAQYNNI